MGLSALHAVLLIVLATVACHAHIFQLTIEEGDRQVIHVQSFGFRGAPSSNCTITVKDFQYLVRGDSLNHWVPSKELPDKPIGFALEGRDTVNSARLEENVRYPEGQCFVYWKRDDRLSLVLPSKHRVLDPVVEHELNPEALAKGPQKFDLSKYVKPGFLSLFFYNCNDNSKTRYTFTIEVVEYNLDDDGRINYLSLGKALLPLMYGCYGVVYTLFFLGFLYLMVKHRTRVHKIHYLMALLVFLKFVSLYLEAAHLYVIQIFGHGRLYADVPYYTTLSLKGMLLFFVILLVGTGWSFIKPFLTENEKKIVLVVVPLVMIDSIAIVVEDTINEGQAAWSTWRDIRRILDVIACCAVLLPVVWSIRN
eukprot:RCo014444